MPVRQLYYTSCRHPTSGQTGFQVKAQSPGITPSALKYLQPLMGYQIPPDLTDQPVETHPVALRYALFNEQTAALVCSQSNGSDEMDRPGNYFAHAVIAEPALLCDPLPPIVYWQSPFWVKSDDSGQVELPVTEKFAASVSFDFDSAWPFIRQGHRHAWFRPLVATVVEGKRRIVILDEPASIVTWIYAVSLALPPSHRARLSFATYHHDPASVSFTITGTTPGFQAGGKFFVLNAFTGQISDAPLSTYTEFVCDYFEPSQYEREVLPLFQWLTGRSSVGALDDLTSFYLATIKGSLARDRTKVLAGASLIAGDVTKKADVQPQDLQDLRTALTFLGDALDKSMDAERLDHYLQALTTLHRIDPDFPGTCTDTFDHLVAAILNQQPKAVRAIQQVIEQLYPYDLFTQILYERLPELARQINHLAPINLFWQYLGPHLQFSVTNQTAFTPLFQAAFATLDAQPTPDPLQVPETATQLIALLFAAVGVHRDFLVHQAAEYKHDHAQSYAFEWVYYTAIEKLPVSQRLQHYWPVYWDQFAELYRYELRRELMKHKKTEELLALLEAWLQALNADWQPVILHEALEFCWNTVDRQRFATYLLAQEHVTAIINPSWHERLIESSLAQATITRPDAETAAMYAKFSAEIPLNPVYLGVIQGALALYHRHLDERSIPTLRRRFEAIDEKLYRQEIAALFATFLQPDSHLQLIEATYLPQHRDIFWEVYWQQLSTLLVKQQKIIDTVQLFNFWFQRSARLIETLPYAVPEFFIQVLDALRALRDSRGYKQIEQDFEARLAQAPWFPAIQPAFQKSRKGLLGGFIR